ncbi:CARDB domain-containing protein [Halobellus marinus]|uniref:CARDB domain-containing protein n=1 Tax=Halobellus TaxID=1073986 RepID=UPI0028AD2C10|nr:CARDB domain-containing protein [Halobellus sp. DFY28]
MEFGNTKIAILLVASLSVTAATGAVVTGFDIGGQQVSIDATEATPTEGTDSALRVGATLNNTGTASETRSVTLLIDGNETGTARTEVAERRVTIPPGATETVSFDVAPAAVQSGTVAYAVVVADGNEPFIRRNGTVNLDPPRLVPTDTTASTVVRGKEASVRATIRNQGDFQGMQTIELRLDRNSSRPRGQTEMVVRTDPVVAPGEQTELALAVPTENLRPGIYAYRVSGPDTTTEGTLTVLQPATFRFEAVDAPANVTRGEEINVTGTVRNEGDVSGAATLSFDPSNETGEAETQSIRLDGADSQTFQFTLNTSTLDRGNYSPDLTVANETTSVPLRVRDSHFEVGGIPGTQTLDIGEDRRFEATIANTGDLQDNQSVEFRIDLNGDNEPEPYGIERSVALDPGEETTVEFSVEYDELAEAAEPGQMSGSHIYGVYSEDDSATAVAAYEPDYDTDSTTSSGTSGEVDTASLDEITQSKYGYDFDEISGETQTQVEEIHERQPFADGLVVTEVLTREEIARQWYGLNVEAGDEFNFSAIDVETQQQIEADFDAQFQSQTGDRIESWDELARQDYDSEYENLTDEQQQTIRKRYWEQFEDS